MDLPLASAPPLKLHVFDDPDHPGWRWGIDVEFLLSAYTCVWGQTCPGIREDAENTGCCTFGAGLQDYEVDRLEERVAELTPETWQNHGRPWRRGSKEFHTRVFEGTCVLYNRDGFAGGGCALHGEALRRDEDPVDWKPNTCFTVPMFVETDDEEKLHKLIRAERKDWGEENGELLIDWWCTEEPIAYVGAEPMFRSYTSELEENLGTTLAIEVIAHLENLNAKRAAPALGVVPLPMA